MLSVDLQSDAECEGEMNDRLHMKQRYTSQVGVVLEGAIAIGAASFAEDDGVSRVAGLGEGDEPGHDKLHGRMAENLIELMKFQVKISSIVSRIR
jgi:hypothetical protein